MSKENEVFIKAANNIFIALINIWSNEITQKHCLEILEKANNGARRKTEIYQYCCNEPWKVLLWIYCSLNSKGSAKGAKDNWWKEFDKLCNLIQPEKLYKVFDGDDEKVFYAINIIMRYYAGGRFLTVSKEIYPIEYANLKKLNFLDESTVKRMVLNLESKTSITNRNNIVNTPSYQLFEIYRNGSFRLKKINALYPDLDLFKSNHQKLELLNGVKGKYARNIKMDLRTPDVEQKIAIDDRIKKILKTAGLENIKLSTENNYEEIESFIIYNILGSKSISSFLIHYRNRPKHLKQMTGWEIDRLLFGLTDPKKDILTVHLPQKN